MMYMLELVQVEFVSCPYKLKASGYDIRCSCGFED